MNTAQRFYKMGEEVRKVIAAKEVKKAEKEYIRILRSCERLAKAGDLGMGFKKVIRNSVINRLREDGFTVVDQSIFGGTFDPGLIRWDDSEK